MAELADGSGSRSGLVERLFDVFSRQLGEIEARLANHEDGESDTRLLNSLAKTLETLIAMERRIGHADEAEAVDVEGLRTELANRLKALRSRGVPTQTDGPADDA